jgi:hypothetical protein
MHISFLLNSLENMFDIYLFELADYWLQIECCMDQDRNVIFYMI